MALDLSKYGATPIFEGKQSGGPLNLSQYGATSVSGTDTTAPQRNLASQIWADITTHGTNISNELAQSHNGALNQAAGGFNVAGEAARGVGDVAGDLIGAIPGIGAAAKTVGGLVGRGFNAITDRLSNTKFFQEAAAGVPEGGTLEKSLGIAKNAGDIATTILTADQGAKAGNTAANFGTKSANSLANTLAEPPEAAKVAQNKGISRVAADWQRPATVNTATFNKARAALEKAPDTPKFLAEQGINPDTAVVDGRFETADAAQALRDDAGKLSHDTLRPSLQMADYSTPKTTTSDIASAALKRASSEFGVTAGDAESVAANIQKEIDALKAKYPDGMSLTNMHDEGIIYNKNGGYNAFTTAADTNKAIANRAIGSALKDAVATKAPDSVPVNAFNAELGRYYKAADYLDALNTKKAPLTLIQQLRGTTIKYGAAALGQTFGGGVVSAFAGYSLGKALEHFLENLTDPMRAHLLRNLEITNPPAFKAVKGYLAKAQTGNPDLQALPPASIVIPPAPSDKVQMAGRARTILPE